MALNHLSDIALQRYQHINTTTAHAGRRRTLLTMGNSTLVLIKDLKKEQ